MSNTPVQTGAKPPAAAGAKTEDLSTLSAPEAERLKLQLAMLSRDPSIVLTQDRSLELQKLTKLAAQDREVAGSLKETLPLLLDAAQNYENISSATLVALGRLHHQVTRHDERLRDQLENAVLNNFESFRGNERDLITMAFALSGRHFKRPERYINRLSQEIERNPTAFKAKWLANVSHIAIACGLQDTRIFEALMKQIPSAPPFDSETRERVVGAVQEWDACGVIGRLLIQDPALLPGNKRAHYKATIASLDRLDFHYPRLATMMLDRRLANITKMSPVDIARAACDCAILGANPDILLGKIGHYVTENIQSYSGEALITLTEAFARAGKAPLGYVTVSADHALQKCANMSMDKLATLVYSLACLGLKDHPIYEKAASRLAAGASHCSSHTLALAAAGFARAQLLDSQFMKSASRVLLERAASGFSEDFAKFYWASAALGFRPDFPPDLLQSVTRELSFSGSYQDRASLAWGLAVLDPEFDPKTIRFLLSPLNLSIPRHREPRRVDVIAAYHSALAFGIKPPEGMEARVDWFMKNRDAPPKVSQFEDHIGKALAGFPEISIATQTTIAGYHVDFLVSHGSRKIALECDGHYFHHVRNGHLRQTGGADLLKDRILKSLGYEVVRISDSEWEMIPDSPDYLRGKLGLGQVCTSGQAEEAQKVASENPVSEKPVET